MGGIFRVSLDKQASRGALDLMKKFPKKMAEVNEIALFRIGQDVRSDAGDNAPYITGNLKRSLTSSSDSHAIFKQTKNKVEVGSNLAYANLIEFSNRSKKRLFLTKAFKKMFSGSAEKIYREEIEDVLK